VLLRGVAFPFTERVRIDAAEPARGRAARPLVAGGRDVRFFREWALGWGPLPLVIAALPGCVWTDIFRFP
jgi:hypothetical protein